MQSSELHTDVRLVIIACFGDIAMEMHGHFEPYLSTAMSLIGPSLDHEAGHSGDDDDDDDDDDDAEEEDDDDNDDGIDDDDDVECTNELRLSVLEAYTGIVVGLCHGGKMHLITPFFDDFITALDVVVYSTDSDARIVEKALSFASDLFESFKPFPMLAHRLATQRPLMQALIQQGHAVNDERCLEAATRLAKVELPDFLLMFARLHSLLIHPFTHSFHSLIHSCNFCLWLIRVVI